MAPYPERKGIREAGGFSSEARKPERSGTVFPQRPQVRTSRPARTSFRDDGGTARRSRVGEDQEPLPRRPAAMKEQPEAPGRGLVPWESGRKNVVSRDLGNQRGFFLS